MLRFATFAVLLPFVPSPMRACSVAPCPSIEVTSDFTVMLKSQGKPLEGVTVKVTDQAAVVSFLGVTASTGAVTVSGLTPGHYSIRADLLGISAGYHCLYVAETASLNAKQQMTYEWGNSTPATRRIAGRLMDPKPGSGNTRAWNETHRVNVPIRGAKLSLQDPITRETHDAVSDRDGAFAIDNVPAGVYVLHIEGGGSGRSYNATDLLIRLNPNAVKDTLELRRGEGEYFPGSCGGTSLELVDRSLYLM